MRARHPSRDGRWPRRTIWTPPCSLRGRWRRWAPCDRGVSGSRWSAWTPRSGLTEPLLDLEDVRVGDRRAIREQHGGHGLIATVHAHHILGCGQVLLDVDHGVGDAFAVKLTGQSVA